MIEFGTGGFRAVIGEDFNKENVSKVITSLAQYIISNNLEKTVAVGYDFRFTSEYACKWVSEILGTYGIDVLLSNGAVSTPMTMSIVEEYDLDFGVMITASHNPYMYNGVKIFSNHGKDISVETSDKLIEIINKNICIKPLSFNELVKDNLIKYIDFKEIYLNHLYKFISIQDETSLKVLIDPLFGTGMICMPDICEHMGIKDYSLRNNYHDAYFGGLSPNPLEKNMQEDIKILLNDGYDICLGFDSDADRLAVIDDKGRYVDANELFGVSFYYLLKYKGLKGNAVRNIQTSHLIDAISDKYGFKCFETDVGANNVSDEMKSTDSIIGGESSGGIMLKGYIEGKDACFQAALILEMLATLKKPLSEIIEEMQEEISFNLVHKEISINYDKNYKEILIEKMYKSLPEFSNKLISKEYMNNNIKYVFENGSWCLLRFSGTEPVIRVFVEDYTYSEIESKINILQKYICESIE